MHFQYVVTPPTPTLPIPPAVPTPTDTATELLRQLLDVQREHLGFIQTQAAGQDQVGRWRAFLARWDTEFPGLGESCRKVLPQLERAYLKMIEELTQRLQEEESASLENEFALNEFLDRYGLRMSQLGTILNQICPLVET